MYCTYCGQEFSRAEHLERHILTRKLCRSYIAAPRPSITDADYSLLCRYQCETLQVRNVSFILWATVSGLLSASRQRFAPN